MEIAVGCEKEDPLCLHLMGESGMVLAKHIVALMKKAHNVIHPFRLVRVWTGNEWPVQLYSE